MAGKCIKDAQPKSLEKSNQNEKIPLHKHQDGSKLRGKKESTDKDVKEYTAHENFKGCSCCGKQVGGSSRS